MLVEKVPGHAPEEAEAGARVVGEEEVARVALPEGVEVAGLDVDAGALDLQVDEGVGPDVVANLGFLHVEEARGGVVGIGGKAREVANVGTYLQS